MRGQVGTTTQIIERFAAKQHGNVARAQLLEADVDRSAIDRRVANGLLFPRYRGVYRVGHRAPSVLSDYAASVLAGGEGTLLYGVAAGHLHRLVKKAPSVPHVLTRTQRRINGVVTRCCRDITVVQRTLVRNIPVISVPETLVALAAVLDEDALARACHEATVLYRTTPAMVDVVLSRYPAARGAATLRAVMAGDIAATLSELERRFLELLRRHGLPLPQLNRIAGTYRVDARWPDHKLTVELDGYRFHNSRQSWRQGLEREREARRRGDEFRRYDWEDVLAEDFVVDELRGLLSRPSAPAGTPAA